MTELALQLLKRIWRDDYSYAKGGIMLADFYDPGTCQPGLFDGVPTRSGGDEAEASVTRLYDPLAGFAQGQIVSIYRMCLCPVHTN